MKRVLILTFPISEIDSLYFIFQSTLLFVAFMYSVQFQTIVACIIAYRYTL